MLSTEWIERARSKENGRKKRKISSNRRHSVEQSITYQYQTFNHQLESTKSEITPAVK